MKDDGKEERNEKGKRVEKKKREKKKENIARGTMDPEIDSVTWIKFGNKQTQTEMKIEIKDERRMPI